jgi:hypothetical protein
MREDAQIRALTEANGAQRVIAGSRRVACPRGPACAALDASRPAIAPVNGRAATWASVRCWPGLLAYIDINVAETASNIWS